MLDLISFAISCSYRKFCDNWDVGQFFFECVGNVFANCLDISAEQFRNLISIKPHGILLNPYIEFECFVRLIDYYLVFLRRFHTQRYKKSARL